MPVGGITPANMGAWRDAGATGFGIGSALYKPGKSAAAVREAALDFVAAFNAVVRA
jgi:2-dehydro-3-deoxyphosphogalactonate aldolase